MNTARLMEDLRMLRKAKDYRFGRDWMFIEPEVKAIREAKAEILEDCVLELRLIMNRK